MGDYPVTLEPRLPELWLTFSHLGPTLLEDKTLHTEPGEAGEAQASEGDTGQGRRQHPPAGHAALSAYTERIHTQKLVATTTLSFQSHALDKTHILQHL